MLQSMGLQRVRHDLGTKQLTVVASSLTPMLHFCAGDFFFSFSLSWVFVAAEGLSLVVASGGCSLVLLHKLLCVVASLVAAGSWT